MRCVALAFAALALSAAPVNDCTPLILTGLQTGDIVFRQGGSWISEAVRMADRQSDYSHAGIVCIHDRNAFVVHAQPAEGLNGHGGVLEVPIEEFFSVHAASRMAVLRVRQNLEPAAARAARAAHGYLRRPFDTALDLSSGSSLYCTELIWRCYRDAGVDLLQGRVSRVAAPMFDIQVILPSDLAASPLLRPVAAVRRIQ